MNDYKLINSLLEDGSPESLLKLKMVFNFDELLNNCYTIDNHPFTKIKYQILFVKQFKEKIAKLFLDNPIHIFCFKQKTQDLKLLKYFVQALSLVLKNIQLF